MVVYKIITNFVAMKRKLKPIKHVEVGAVEFDFYFKKDSAKCTYLEIKCGEVTTFHIDGRTHAYGYLLEAANQGLNDQLHGYAVILYMLATGLTKDQTLVDDVVGVLNNYRQRIEAEGAQKASEVTEEQESAEQAFMEEVVAETTMSEAEREANREAFKETVKQVIEEKEDGI